MNSPELSGNSPQIYECYWFVCKKNLRIFCDVIVQSSLKCPRLSVCTVKLIYTILLSLSFYWLFFSFFLLKYCRPSMYQNSTLQLYLHYLRQRKIAHNLCTKIHKMSHLDSSSVKSSFSASITVACNENTLLNI